jgi:hypothetical protein
MISKGLRTWFVIHFAIDIIFAIPLLVAPLPFLTLLGWTAVDPYTARLVGAALMAIGIESYLGRNAGVEAFQGMLNLKIIWSATAIAGTLLTMMSGYWPWGAWLLLAAFIPFNIIWVYYRRQLRNNS